MFAQLIKFSFRRIKNIKYVKQTVLNHHVKHPYQIHIL